MFKIETVQPVTEDENYAMNYVVKDFGIEYLAFDHNGVGWGYAKKPKFNPKADKYHNPWTGVGVHMPIPHRILGCIQATSEVFDLEFWYFLVTMSGGWGTTLKEIKKQLKKYQDVLVLVEES